MTPDTPGTDAVVAALLEFRGGKIRSWVQARLAEGAAPGAVLGELVSGLDAIGDGYGNPGLRRYFTSDLIVSGRNMRRAIEIIRPLLPPDPVSRGTVVIGTVQGDVHDIGKTIVAITLEAHGFRTIDLGTDVPPEHFAEAVRNHRPNILCLSALLSSTAPSMRDVIRLLDGEKLRDGILVMAGGRAVDRAFAEQIGADAYAEDSVEALRLCREWVAKKGPR